jgi:hypothetical protein
MTKSNKKELENRVLKAKKQLKELQKCRSDFFDNVYGAMFDKQNMKIQNLWLLKTTDEEFTKLLEKYVSKTKNLTK